MTDTDRRTAKYAEVGHPEGDSFDVMRDPWLKVIMMDGEKKEVSLYEAITEAHRIKDIVPPGLNKLTAYMIYAFIIDFTQWVYKPVAHSDRDRKRVIREMFDRECFDRETLDRYISYYENDLGLSFNVFDDEKPFLQMKKAETVGLFEKGRTRLKNLSTGKFGIEYTSGNNVLFEHRRNAVTWEQYEKLTAENGGERPAVEDCYRFSRDEVVAALIYPLGYCQAVGSTAVSSISACGKGKQLPVYVLIKGDTLFATICASIGVAVSAREEDAYSCRPAWEREKYRLTVTDLAEMIGNSSDHIGLSYVPTAYIYLKNMYEAWVKDIQYKREEQPRNLYSELVKRHPRVLRDRFADDSGSDAEDNVSALVYQTGSGDKGATEIQTHLIQLGCCTEKCQVIKTNYAALSEMEDAPDLEVCFYAVTHMAGTSMPEIDRVITWPKGVDFASEEDSMLFVKNILTLMKKLSNDTAYMLTAACGIANGACVRDSDGKYRSCGGELKNYRSYAATAARWATEDCLNYLDTHYCQKIVSGDMSSEDRREILTYIFETYAGTFERYSHNTPRLSMLHLVRVEEDWRARVAADCKERSRDADNTYEGENREALTQALKNVFPEEEGWRKTQSSGKRKIKPSKKSRK